MFKWVAGGIVTLIGIIALAFILNLGGLEWKRFFKPKMENIEREVFEETQSYVHGKIQELAKYKIEYNNLTEPEDKVTIKEIIIMRFAEFDEKAIKADGLRNFLIEMRGY